MSERAVVLFAVAGQVRKDFFPDFDAGELPGAEILWPDIGGWKEDDWQRALSEIRPRVVVTGWGTPGLPVEPVHFPGFLCHLAGSVRGLVPRQWIERGVLVGNWGKSISFCIAEHAMLLALGALRSLPLWRPFMEGGKAAARTELSTRCLRGKRVGIHGFGAVVGELLPMLRSFGVEISVYSEGVPEKMFRDAGVKKAAGLGELMAGSEVFIELEALTGRSRGSVDEKMLNLLPEGAVFVNVGRGAVVDEEALARVAVRKKLRLGLDVFVREPLPEDSPLRSIPLALLSPHVAGPTGDCLSICGAHALGNVRRFLKGEEIEGRVSLEVFDRST